MGQALLKESGTQAPSARPRFAGVFTASGMAFAAFALITACFVGLPVDFNPDYVSAVLRGVRALGYGDLVKLILDPRTPAWFYPADGAMEYLRPLQFLWTKIYFDLFKTSMVPFHVTAAVGAGLLAFVFVVYFYRRTGRLLWGCLAVLLYMSFPSNFFMLVSFFPGDFQYTVSLLSLGGLLAFASLARERGLSKMRFLALACLWVFSVWLAIKLKSSEKIIPVVCLAFLMIRFRWGLARFGWRRMALLLALAGALLVLVIPNASVKKIIKNVPNAAPLPSQIDKDVKARSFQFDHLIQRAFLVPSKQNEKHNFHFFPKDWGVDQMPRSFSENYGFVGALFFWSSLVAFWGLPRFRKAEDKKTEAVVHDAILFSVWFAVVLAGFGSGLPVEDTRLLNFAYVPSVLLLFLLIDLQERLLGSERTKRIYRGAVLLGLAVIVYPNYRFFFSAVRVCTPNESVIVRAERDVFRDFYGRPPRDWELYERHPELENRAMVTDWYELAPDWLDGLRHKVAREKKAYFYTETEKPEDSEDLKALLESGLRVEPWKHYDLFDSGTLYFRIKKAVREIRRAKGKKVKTRNIYVYRITAPAG